MTRHFIDIDDLSAEELEEVLDRAVAYKEKQHEGVSHPDLERQTLGMLFQKPSTRTRVSFETGMTQLGGHAVFLGERDIQLGHGEPLKDTARALSGYVDAIMARVFEHANIEELARYATVPVINGLTDDAHPCQTLADLLTIREAVGELEGTSVAWVGDANNVARSFALGCAIAGVDLTVATPPEYALDADHVERADSFGAVPTVTDDPAEAVAGADVVYTDVWISMGQEDQRDYRLAAFEGFQVNEDLLADTDARVMHCLPAHRGEEITDEVVEGERSLVFEQAENRLHAQKGLLSWLLEE
ncbi:ornithine carbamoyltransferase [Halalkalicoccus jeotgali]|uniref:Ornithine carbamoyltransferase n=1 Tax=Halalkalicoccus jeotgali (strain DSM 18796 / CECT 7217 / JCM 14584 / KCTC 4019 / B3) TaxID=795797 RepID=D8J505_HALJB|nr:ornithine carbamoyltransferase [Halalkalicoccus jeotgali]ADJ13586.1 ornithine carbamoyltransferase [Halalkalicoccus jeotgali B3]ELY33393.1 ornithine carbamoyltransferase [Halalkalicoccus jeotgali B3]